ncbi:fatty acid desaturase family protein [Gryllotalpicola protaetiae]|uniref:Acyl-CoA desaturase n=1 Tax=Gryllotalpicola protaetiae TaxID=2419771 RepID=A0A387BKF1_9MICO|nr:acyl-CoA desaturase [Gryllotalpicola protaetiae]AYG03128.1 acyl-CoA desaturase [Gryllotalpicola protaetiae]
MADAAITTGNNQSPPPTRPGPIRTTGRPSDRAGQPRQSTDFAELSEKIRAAGLLRRRRGYYWTKFWLITAALAALVMLFVRVGDSWWQMVIAGAFAFVFTQAAFLGHDAAHRQVFQSGHWNNWASLVIGNLFVGMSVGWWNNKHNRHHANPNRVGYDPDIDIPVVRPNSFTRLRGRSRAVAWTLDHQSVGFFPFLFFQGILLHIWSFQRLCARTSVPHRSIEIGLILIRLGGFAGLAFLVLTPGRAAAFLGIQLAVFGFHLGAVFAINHMGMPIVPKDLKLDFFRRQVVTGRNIRGGQLTSFTMGGLNYQIEHHLFPSMARPQLRHAAPLVEAFCMQRDVPYTQTGVRAAFRSVAEYIDKIGLGHQDPFECPMIAQRQVGSPVV